MTQPDYINAIELLKSESDLKTLQEGMDTYSQKVNVTTDSEFTKIQEILHNYFTEIKNNRSVKPEDIQLLRKRWRKFMVSHAGTSLWKARATGFIVGVLIFTPLYYLTTHTTPGYELLVVIPLTTLCIYVITRPRKYD